MAIIGRVLEGQGLRVGIIAQPDWHDSEPFRALGRPRLFFGITAGNMDSMVNRYTSDRRVRSDDAYTPDGAGGKRPDRSVIVYAQRAREAYRDVPIIIGSIEASLRRIAHYDYWSEKVRRSILLDCEGRPARLRQCRARRSWRSRGASMPARRIEALTDIRGTAFMRSGLPAGWIEIDSTHLDAPGPLSPPLDPYAMTPGSDAVAHEAQRRRARRERRALRAARAQRGSRAQRDPPAGLRAGGRRSGAVRARLAHPAPGVEPRATRARWCSGTATRDVWLNPPPIPLTTPEMDWVYDLPYARRPHPAYGKANIPAYKMIRFSVAIQRGCFGGCTFCSITEHEGRIIQNRSEDSVIREIETDPRQRAGLHRRDLRSRRADREHVPPRLQEPRDRVRVPPALVRVSGNLPEPQYRPRRR